MKIKSRFPRLLAAVLSLCALLSACSGPQTPTQAPTEAPRSEPIALTADFRIICTDRDSEELLAMAKALRDGIKSRTGYDLRITYNTGEVDCEILLGYTYDRPACAEGYEGLKGSDYAVYAVGTKAVLAAYTGETMQSAVDLFLEKALVQTGTGWGVSSCAVYGDTAMAVEGDLSEYKIIYPAGDSHCRGIANELKVFLLDKYGVMIAPKADTDAAPSDYEFVIGQTNRGIPEGTELAPWEWAITAQGHRVYLYGSDAAAAGLAVRAFCETAASAFGPRKLYLAEGSQVGSVIDTQDEAALAEGAEIRIMSYNILHESWSNVDENVPVAPRAEKLTALLLYYRPDVVGLQEVSADWHGELDALIAENGYYTKVCETTGAGKQNLTTFLYNPETVKPVDSYVIDLDKGSNIRVVSVVVFERLATGEQFVVTNTHPAPTSNKSYAGHIAAIVEQSDALIRKYDGLPVILLGDFNTRETSQYYNTLLTLPVSDAKYSAEILVRNYESFLNPRWGGSPAEGNEKSFDHIFCTEDITVLLFNTVIDNQVDTLSDHLPIYADIRLD